MKVKLENLQKKLEDNTNDTGMGAFHKVKYRKIEKWDIFAEALERLEKKVYSSHIAEYRRNIGYQTKFKLRLLPDDVFSMILKDNIDTMKFLAEDENYKYYRNKNDHVVAVVQKDKFIEFIFIVEDVIYWIKYSVKNTGKYTELTFAQDIKSPVTLDIFAAHSMIARIRYKKSWKARVKAMKQPLLKHIV